jgi:hypothetical protein
VEWSKARAQRDLWVEEVQLLCEEMKRVLRTIQGEWAARAEACSDIDPELMAGLWAYALRQVYVHCQIAEVFHSGWSSSMVWSVRQVVERDGGVYQELLDGDSLDMVPTPTQVGRSGSEERTDDAEVDEAGTTTERVTRASTRTQGRHISV